MTRSLGMTGATAGSWGADTKLRETRHGLRPLPAGIVKWNAARGRGRCNCHGNYHAWFTVCRLLDHSSI